VPVRDVGGIAHVCREAGREAFAADVFEIAVIVLDTSATNDGELRRGRRVRLYVEIAFRHVPAVARVRRTSHAIRARGVGGVHIRRTPGQLINPVDVCTSADGQ